MTKKFEYNIRCRLCDSLYERGSFLSARHYNTHDSYRCRDCGCGAFVAGSEYFVSASVWYKPTTWFKGYWKKEGGYE